MTEITKYSKNLMSYGRRMRRSAGGRIAQVFSDIFSPLLIPTYAYILMMWFTPMVLLPERIRMVTVIIVAGITGVIPMALILTLRRLGLISDNAISSRRQRIIPLIVTTLCYVATAIYLVKIGAPGWITRFFYGAAGACAVAAVISKYWKISAHMTAISGMTTQILYLCFRHLLIISPMIVLTLVIMLTGIIGSCRIRLLRHTLLQVFGGTGLGFLAVLIAQFI